MLMFNEFCRALELIEKSGKNGSKQQCLDSLWQKVLQGTLLFKQHCSFFFPERSHTIFLPSPVANAAAIIGQRTPVVSARAIVVRSSCSLFSGTTCGSRPWQSYFSMFCRWNGQSLALSCFVINKFISCPDCSLLHSLPRAAQTTPS